MLLPVREPLLLNSCS